MPQPNQIPSHPQANAAAAAAGGTPVQVHQPSGMIPAHPDAIAARVQQQGVRAPQPAAPSPAPTRDVMQDFFAQAAFGDDGDDASDFQPVVPQAPQGSQPNTDLVDVDDLLSGGEFTPEPVPVPQPQQQTPQPQAAQPQAPAPAQPTPQAPPAAPSPEQIQAQAIDYLRDNVYKFDEETTRKALTEPEVVLPQLAARLHVNLVNEFAQQMHRTLPTLIEREVTRRTAVIETKNEFFRRYPKLNRPEWDGVVADSVAMAAQIHQGQPRDVIMREGAALAAYRLRSQVPRQPPAQGRPQPFVPASGSGGGSVVPTNPQQGANVWAELAADPDLMNY